MTTTGAPVLLRPDGPPGPHAVGADGMSEPLDAETFAARVREGGGGRLEVGLGGGAAFELLDTPGVADTEASRSERAVAALPQADVLVLVLDATQLFGRTEQRFLEQATAALGGLETSGATVLVAANRIDLVPDAERDTLRDHLREHLPDLDPADLFLTSARAALEGADTPGAQEVRRLGERLAALADARHETLPLRARAGLARQAALLEHHAQIQARALSLGAEELAAEIARVEQARASLARDRAADVATLREGAEAALAGSRKRLATFREDLELSAGALVDHASLSVLADRLPGSIHDACVGFLQEETAHLQAALDDLSRRVLRTHGDRAQARLAQAQLRLGAHGPTMFVEPPSLALEAGSLALGVAGTAIMYFGNLVTGMVMTVAGPLATVILREQSVRRARARVRAALPQALDQAMEAIERVMEQSVHGYVRALEEHLELSDRDLGERLASQLRHAQARLASGDPAARARAQAELARARAELDELCASLGAPGTP